MKKKILITLASMMAITSGVALIGQELKVSLADDSNITTYLVLSSNGLYKGNKGENFAAPLYIENAIKFEAKAGSALPGKDDITLPGTAGEFDHWETYEGTGFPTVYDKVPAESGKILYAFYSNNGTTPTPPDPPIPPNPDEDEKTYYLDTGGASLWGADNAWFAAYLWNSSGNTWMKLSYVTGNIYSFTVDTTYTNVIFVRMDKEKTNLAWESKWNQTNDLTLGSSNCYKITGWGSEKSEGSWTTYSPSI